MPENNEVEQPRNCPFCRGPALVEKHEYVSMFGGKRRVEYAVGCGGQRQCRGDTPIDPEEGSPYFGHPTEEAAITEWNGIV